MFELYTEEAILVLMHAQNEARRLQHNFVSTEQILIGLLCEPVLGPSKVLMEFGVNYDSARQETETIIGRGAGSAEEIPFTKRGKLVLILARNSAEEHRHSYIAPEHLLMGIILDGEGVASRVLKKLGVKLPELQVAVERKFGPPSDDFEEVFYPAKAAEYESLKASIKEMRSNFEQATSNGQIESAQSALERIKDLEWLVSKHKSK
jgi:ATP-dependent Clp protease ATP-binding subunit ClpC